VKRLSIDCKIRRGKQKKTASVLPRRRKPPFGYVLSTLSRTARSDNRAV
jgi:hypothetical protein